MNFHSLLQARADDNRPVRVVVIGVGKFGTMFLSQIKRTPGLHLLGVADLSVEKARSSLLDTGWSEDQFSAASAAKALNGGTTFITDDSEALINAGGVEVVVEATGVVEAGVRHALAAFDRGRHVVMVNVEADALCGPLLARKAQKAGVVYSMAYGDQPALISEQVDWARTCGFEVVAAGKGTLHMPEYHASTPDTIWDHYGIDAKRATESGMNARMFNSFLDGTKSGLEMAAVSNACDLSPAPSGLSFPACSVEDIASTLIPQSNGGCLHHSGQVEVISSRNVDGDDVENNLRWGVYVTFKAPSVYVERCFSDYGLITDESGTYTSLWRPYHLIGLELGVSVASVALLKHATGVAKEFRADVVATAKRDLKSGETLDGEGGYTVWGRLMVGLDSLSLGAVPIGLANGLTLKKPLREGNIVTWSDVDLSDDISDSLAYTVRRQMEAELKHTSSDASSARNHAQPNHETPVA
jgi:predicted homoserine dehydrogenase-like protein